ncbi:MAG: hypothetical protein ACFB0B_12710 [Thermonemataceae bacterium]
MKRFFLLLLGVCLLNAGQAQNNKASLEKIKQTLQSLNYKFQEKSVDSEGLLEVSVKYEAATNTNDSNIPVIVRVNSYNDLEILDVSVLAKKISLESNAAGATQYDELASFLAANTSYKIGALQTVPNTVGKGKDVNLVYAVKIPFTAEKAMVEQLMKLMVQVATDFD